MAPRKRKVTKNTSEEATVKQPAKRAKKSPKETPESNEAKNEAPESSKREEGKKTIYDFVVTDIDGKDVSLSKYKDNVCLIVNVASRCGYTSKNYKELVELDEKFKDADFKILAFPCNQFGKQEPGSNETICNYVRNRKGGQFDLFAKIDVNGKNAHALFQFLRAKCNNDAPIKWNFCKFLVGKNGEPVEYFLSKVSPMQLTDNIEALL